MRMPLLTGPNDPSQTQAVQNSQNLLINQLAPGLLNYSVTPGSNGADSSDDTLQSYTLPAGWMALNGLAIRVTAWGVTANNNHVKTLKLKFGATPLVIINQALTVSVADKWLLEAMIMRITATSQTYWGRLTDTGAGLLETNQGVDGAETMANALSLLLTGASGSSAASDITCNGWLVEAIQ